MFNIPTSEIEELWKMVFNIALHTLRNPAEAEDATQEIFEKVVRNYGSFQGNAKLSTWVYRIAYNHLIDMRRSKKTEAISFELFEQDVSSFAPYKGELGLSKTEEKLYAEEVKVGCTLALLQCLKREERLAFILGTIFEFSANQAAKICEVTPTTYRKRLSRAKHKIKNFMQKNCGLIYPNAHCHCRKRLLIAYNRGRICTEKILYQTENPHIYQYIQEMNQVDQIAKVYQSNPYQEVPANLLHILQQQVTMLQATSVASSKDNHPI